MSTSSEKLVYLQNGVFKRKEMETGLQYYHNGAFKTFPLPSGNGTFVLSNYNNDFTWVDAGTVVPEQPEEFTTLDNSYFKGSDGQAITIGSQGTIPFFKNNATFGSLDLPESGIYVLRGGTNPSFETMDAEMLHDTLGYENTNGFAIMNWNSTTSNRKNLTLPNKSGTFLLMADSNINFVFSSLNAKILFNHVLGIGSDTQRIVSYWGDNAYGLEVPTTTGYATFKIENSNTSPLITNLTSTAIYQSILGCDSTEHCLVYNNGTTVSKLDVPTTNGSYLLNVSSNGVSFTTPPTKLATTFNYEWTGSGHSVVTESLTSTNTNLSSSITLSSNSKYLFTFDIGLKCTNYEQAFIGFTDDPFVTIGVKPTIALRMYLNATSSTLHASGSCVGSPTTTGELAISVARGGDTTISHIYTHFQVTIVEL